MSNSNVNDADCDLVATSVDCDDADPGNTLSDDCDGDGVGRATDCDDNDPARAPGLPEICDGAVDNDCDVSTVEDDETWWNTAWPYRVDVTVTGSAHDIAGPPVSLDMDFDALLAAVSDNSPFQEDSVRVVFKSCAASLPEIPSVFTDGAQNLLGSGAIVATTGDETGAVTFLFDTDGDLSTQENISAGSTHTFSVYFASNSTGQNIVVSDYSAQSSNSATTTSIGNAEVSGDLDAAQGGLLMGVDYGSATDVWGQDPGSGNGIHAYTYAGVNGWLDDATNEVGTVTVLENSPVVSIAQASGNRGTVGDGLAVEMQYDYTYTYYTFGDRPEMWVRVNLTTSEASQFDWDSNYTHRVFRPFVANLHLDNVTETFENGWTPGLFFDNQAAFAASDWMRFDGDAQSTAAPIGITWAPVSVPTFVSTYFYYNIGSVPDRFIGIEGQNLFDVVFPDHYENTHAQNTIPWDVPAGTDLTGYNTQLFVFHDQADSTVGNRTKALTLGVSTNVGAAIAQP